MAENLSVEEKARNIEEWAKHHECGEVFRAFIADELRGVEKRRGAEVLAAVLAKMDGPKMNHADLYRAIQKLQPAAKALEALLQDKWREALIHCRDIAKEHGHRQIAGSKSDWGKGYNAAMLEIERHFASALPEKARATLEKS